MICVDFYKKDPLLLIKAFLECDNSYIDSEVFIMKKTYSFLLASASTLTLALAIGVVSFASNGRVLKMAYGADATVWNHYSASAHLDARGNKEYWVSCNTHEHQFSAPSTGTIVDMGTLDQAEIDSWASNDDRVVSKRRRVLSFENSGEENYITMGHRTGYTSLEVIDTDASSGSKCLKVVPANSTMNFNLNQSYLDEAFADPSVVGIAFEAKASWDKGGWSYRTYNGGAQQATEYSSYITTEWRTYMVPRSFYEGYSASNQKNQYHIVWLGCGDDYATKYVLFDNFRAVTKAVDIYGFETDRLDTSGTSNYIRNKNNKACIHFTGVGVDGCSFDYDIKTEGMRSVKFHKSNGADLKVAFASDVGWTDLNLGADDEVAFDLYTTYAWNGNTVFKGGVWGAKFISDSYFQPANTWATYTIKSSEMDSSHSLIRFTGSLEADIYIDNIRVRRSGANNLGFETEELSTTDWTSTNHDQGYYGGNGKTNYLFKYQANRSTAHIGVTYAMASEGSKSFHFSKLGANELTLWLGADYGTRVKNGETLKFDLYATETGANNDVGDGNRVSYTGDIFPERQWCTVSVNASNLTGDYRFLIIKGDAKGDFYLDNFCFAE